MQQKQQQRRHQSSCWLCSANDDATTEAGRCRGCCSFCCWVLQVPQVSQIRQVPPSNLLPQWSWRSTAITLSAGWELTQFQPSPYSMPVHTAVYGHYCIWLGLAIDMASCSPHLFLEVLDDAASLYC